jgi:cytochrome c-type biogenesis protein CcmF
MAGSALSHFGFSIMIIGILASGLNEKIISKNPFVMQGLIKNKDLARVVQLIKDEPLFAEGYWMTYKSDTIIGNNRIFTVGFKEVDLEGNEVDSFDLYPNVLYSNDFKKVAASNPSTKHYISKDIFSSIASLPKTQMDVKFMKEMEDTLDYKPYEMFLGDTLFTSKYYGIIKDISFAPSSKEYLKETHDFGLESVIEFKDIKTGKSNEVKTALGLKDNMVFSYPTVANDFGIKVRLNEEAFTNFFTPENLLAYTEFEMKEGETISYAGFDITLKGFNRPPKNPDYKSKETDIAISAILEAKKNDETAALEPVFLIRDMQPNGIKDYDVVSGLHSRFEKVDPKSEVFTLRFATDDRSQASLPIQIADGVPRTDLIVLEVKEFPGINLFWLGTISMMLGFLLALWNRFKS